MAWAEAERGPPSSLLVSPFVAPVECLGSFVDRRTTWLTFHLGTPLASQAGKLVMGDAKGGRRS